MSVNVKSEIEKLEGRYSVGSNYIKQINHSVSNRLRNTYMAKYNKYQEVIKYFEEYIMSLLDFHEKNHRDINSCPITEMEFINLYNNANHTYNKYKSELSIIKDSIVKCSQYPKNQITL